MATIRSGLLAPSAPLFAPLSVLFEQRILVVLNSGLFPKPSFADFQANFQSERYQPRELLQQAISSFEEAQRGAVQLAHRSSVISETMVREDCAMLQRVGVGRRSHA